MEDKNRYETKEQTEREAQRPQGYRRPARNPKKRKLLGRFSLCAALISVFLLAAIGVYAFYGLWKSALSPTDIRMAIPAVIAVIVVAGVAVLAALLCFFLRKQKKGAAIAGLVLGILVILVCAAALYGYHFVFSEMEHDSEFNELSHEELSAVTVKDDGEVVRQTEPNTATISREEFEEKYENKEISFDALMDEELPEEAAAMMVPDPVNSSYLLEGHEQISNYLLFGIDEKGSSDAILILSVDRVHHKLKLISIARDSYVLIPEWNCHKKLTYAYAWGGAQMAVSTINYNFFLNITDYIAVNVDQLAEIIDYVGGVTVNLDWDEVRYLQRFSGINYGDCLLGGDAAVLYSRIRQSNANDSELKRQGRQREVLTSLLQSAQKMPLSDYPGLVRACLGMCTTSFNSEELMELAMEVLQGGYEIETDYAILNEVDFWGGYLGEDQQFYCVYDMHLASDRLYRIIYEELYVSAYPDEIQEETP